MDNDQIVRWAHYFSELIGTMLMLVIGLSAIVLFFGPTPLAEAFPSVSLRLFLVLVIFAGGIVAMIYSPIGKISGAHMNPAVSLAFWMEGHLKAGDFAGFVVAQLLGAFIAGAVVHFLVGDLGNAVHFGMTRPAADLSPALAVLIEAAMTFGIISLVFYCLHHERLVPWCGALVGVYIVAVAFFAAHATGASMNPARSFGPAVVARDLGSLWIYVVGPLAGAALAQLVHKWVPLLKRPKFRKLSHARHDEGYLHAILARLGLMRVPAA